MSKTQNTVLFQMTVPQYVSRVLACVTVYILFINFLTVLPVVPVSIWFIYVLGLFMVDTRYIRISFFTILHRVPVPDMTT